jgi:hypothetical protein
MSTDNEAYPDRPAEFRKRPVVIEAFRLTRDNAKDVCDWMHSRSKGAQEKHYYPDGTVVIRTLEGDMVADVGDWIIMGVAGEFYPCKPDIFEATYEAVEL